MIKLSPNKGKPISEEHKQKLKVPKTKEHKQKLREANLKPNTRKRLSEINKGKVISDEQKQSEKMKGRPSSRKGVSMSDDSKLKLSKTQKLRFSNGLPLGIWFDKTNKKYRVRCCGKHIGRYQILEDAIQA